MFSPVPLHAATLADLAIGLAKADHRPARRSIYLTPLRRLHARCQDAGVRGVGTAVTLLAHDLGAERLVSAPDAAAEAVLAAGVPHGGDCGELARAYAREVLRPHSSGGVSLTIVHFSPPLTARLALASIEHALLPGRVHVVYALRAYACQQAIFMGPALGRRYRNPGLGAFVELTSGRGVGHGRYDANRVDRARITPLGRIGGQPCT